MGYGGIWAFVRSVLSNYRIYNSCLMGGISLAVHPWLRCFVVLPQQSHRSQQFSVGVWSYVVEQGLAVSSLSINMASMQYMCASLLILLHWFLFFPLFYALRKKILYVYFRAWSFLLAVTAPSPEMHPSAFYIEYFYFWLWYIEISMKNNHIHALGMYKIPWESKELGQLVQGCHETKDGITLQHSTRLKESGGEGKHFC